MDDQRQKSEMQPLKDGRLEQVYSGMDKIGPAATEKCGQRTPCSASMASPTTAISTAISTTLQVSLPPNTFTTWSVSVSKVSCPPTAPIMHKTRKCPFCTTEVLGAALPLRPDFERQGNMEHVQSRKPHVSPWPITWTSIGSTVSSRRRLQPNLASLLD